MCLVAILHILILLAVVAVAVVYGAHMAAKMRKPDNCKYYSLDVSMDLKAKCQVC